MPEPVNDEQTTDENTEDADDEQKPAACEHKYIFHMTQNYPKLGEKHVYRRCTKCNDIKMTVEKNA